MILGQYFGDLHGIEGSALAQIVRNTPEIETIGNRRVPAQATDEDGIFTRTFLWCHIALVDPVINHRDAGRRPQGSTRFLLADRILELNIHSFRMPDEDRRANTGRGNRNIRTEDLT